MAAMIRRVYVQRLRQRTAFGMVLLLWVWPIAGAEARGSATGDQLRAPTEPGRYWLQINFAAGSRVEPLTVGYGPVKGIGWPEDFFPIGFYGVQGSTFNPNPERLADLMAVAQFELGANTFRTQDRTNVNRGGKMSPEALEVEINVSLPPGDCRVVDVGEEH